MIKKYFKYYLKNSKIINRLFVWILYFYLKLAYFTNRWQFIYPENISESQINQKNGLLFAMWHNRLTFGMHIFGNYDNVYALASPHTDGKLITDIIKKMHYKVIEGSSNRKPTEAIREIIKKITSGSKVVITPDGPRGPAYKINSNVTRLAQKYNKDIVPLSCNSSKYFELKSWDKMMIPKLFGEIVVTIGNPLILSGDKIQDDLLLEKTLMDLSLKAQSILTKDI